MKNKKLGIALLTLAIFTNASAKKDREVYQPKSPWPLVVVEDAVVGTAGLLTLGQTDADPSALPMAIPDAIPGVSYARTKDNDSNDEAPKKQRRVKKECTTKKEKPAKVKKEKSCKKPCDSTTKTTRTKKAKSDKATKVVTAPVVVPAAVFADVVTLDTEHFTTRAVDSMNDDSDTDDSAE